MKPILTLAIILAASVAHAAAYRIPDGSILALPSGARLTIPDGSVLVTPDEVVVPEPRPEPPHPPCPRPEPRPRPQPPRPQPPHNPGPRRHIMPLASLGWLAYRPIRQVSGLPAILADVESHLPAGHPYDDPDRITTVHECTHGINSLLRNRYGRPAFYVLNNRAALLDEPATTLAAVAAHVPPSLQGEVYELYLVEPQDGWNDRPSYVFDEWTAYTNGADARQQLGIQDRQETLRYALEFCVYATCT